MMKKALVITRITIFWLAVLIIAIFILSLTIGQKIPIEFADWRLGHRYYNTIAKYLPLAFLLTLLQTMKEKYSAQWNIAIFFTTITTAFVSYYVFGLLIFAKTFGAWTDELIIYKNISHPSITVRQQIYDVGALGYGSRRVVQIKPFLNYWNMVRDVDTSKLKTSEWQLMNQDLIFK